MNPEDLVATLRRAGCVYAEDEAAALLASATSPEHLAALVRRRVAGEPLEHVVGWVEFCGLRIAVDQGVFVPRRRTELVAELTVALAPAVVVELCCGAAAIAHVVAARLPRATVYAADVDPVAVGCARRNVPTVYEGDLYEALPPSLQGTVDVIAVNAPYVPTREIPLMPAEARLHEPAVALDGGTDGLDLHRRIAAGAPHWLKPGGWLIVETSNHQRAGTIEAATKAGLDAHVETDDERDAVVVCGQRLR